MPAPTISVLLLLPVGTAALSFHLHKAARVQADSDSWICPPNVPQDQLGSWKMATQTTTGRNLCIKGKLVPQLYVLGEPKTATTSFTWDLMSAGVETLGRTLKVEQHAKPQDYCFKEMHYFDNGQLDWSQVQSNGSSAFSAELSRWRDLFVDCDETAADTKRRVVADFTPSNLCMVPRPWASLNIGHRQWEQEGMDLPKLLKGFYGSAARELSFVIQLREPLSMLQSLFYCCMDNGAPKQSGQFQSALVRHMTSARDNVTLAESWFWRLFFARHLEGWLEHFDPSQFVIVLFDTYTSGDRDGVCRHLSERLAFNMDCDSRGAPASKRSNKGDVQPQQDHPPIDKDVTPQVRERFDTMFNPELDRLVNLLANASSKGMHLASFEGAPGSSHDIRQWLTTFW